MAIGMNGLLASLPAEEKAGMLSTLERVTLEAGTVLHDCGSRVTWNYFPLSGLLSIQSTTTLEGHAVELVTMGAEGMVGIETVLQVQAARCRAVTVTAVEALRIRAARLSDEVERRATLRQRLLQYSYSLLEQTSQAAVCHRFHTVAQRLARWLLVARERLRSDAINLTQDTVANLLGSPRTGVTTAVMLQDRGAIRQRHGRLLIVNATILRQLACECYKAYRAETAGTLNGLGTEAD